MMGGDPAPSDKISESRNQRMMECLARLVSCANTGIVRGPTRQGKKRDVRILGKRAGWSSVESGLWGCYIEGLSVYASLLPSSIE